MTVYDVHGIAVEVRADDPSIAAAVEERLRHFARTSERPAIVYEYVHGSGRVRRPPGTGRPVYDPTAGRGTALHRQRHVHDRLRGPRRRRLRCLLWPRQNNERRAAPWLSATLQAQSDGAAHLAAPAAREGVQFEPIGLEREQQGVDELAEPTERGVRPGVRCDDERVLGRRERVDPSAAGPRATQELPRRRRYQAVRPLGAEWISTGSGRSGSARGRR